MKDVDKYKWQELMLFFIPGDEVFEFSNIKKKSWKGLHEMARFF